MKIFISILVALFTVGVLAEKSNAKAVVVGICYCVSMAVLFGILNMA